MEQWLESVYSDGTQEFVSIPNPKLRDIVTIRIRMYEDAPVKHVLLRTVPNGAERIVEAEYEKTENGLIYYAAQIEINEARIQYQFYLVCDSIVYYYNQRGITTYIPDQSCDFVLLAGYRQPSWVKDSVFYQIFPDRFCNGDTSNDVKDGEYTLNGHPTIHMDWTDTPLEFHDGFNLDFFGGDLQGVKEKIPYLKELGVTAVYLNPIFMAPSVHKYDCIDYFHVDPHFGGDEALAQLSAALHENGMKLILDISINHTGTAHKWFNRDGLFFDKKYGAYNNSDSEERGYYFFKEGTQEYKGWFDVSDLPTLNYTSDKLRDIIYRAKDSVLKKWLKPPYSIDGWRFDVADVMARNDEIQLSHELWPQIAASIKEENPEAYILAEDWGDCTPYLQGNEWDSPMNYYGCGRVLRQFAGEPDLFNARNDILSKVPYKMTAEDVQNRIMEYLSRIPFAMWQNQFNLIDSHDVQRLHTNPVVNPMEYRGAVILQFTLIGTASIYYGDEAAAAGWDNNEGFRHPMPWNSGFENSDTYKLYQTLAHLKRDRKAFSEDGMKFLYAENGVVAIARFYGDEVFAAVMSVNDEDTEIVLPIGAVGAASIKNDCDVLGEPIEYTAVDSKRILMKVKAHQSYMMECIK